jgi:hypothetical protein
MLLLHPLLPLPLVKLLHNCNCNRVVQPMQTSSSTRMQQQQQRRRRRLAVLLLLLLLLLLAKSGFGRWRQLCWAARCRVNMAAGQVHHQQQQQVLQQQMVAWM